MQYWNSKTRKIPRKFFFPSLFSSSNTTLTLETQDINVPTKRDGAHKKGNGRLRSKRGVGTVTPTTDPSLLWCQQLHHKKDEEWSTCLSVTIVHWLGQWPALWSHHLSQHLELIRVWIPPSYYPFSLSLLKNLNHWYSKT